MVGPLPASGLSDDRSKAKHLREGLDPCQKRTFLYKNDDSVIENDDSSI